MIEFYQDRNWPNGNYCGKCTRCEKHFVGPKRSLYCYKCYYDNIKLEKSCMIEDFLIAKKEYEMNEENWGV